MLTKKNNGWIQGIFSQHTQQARHQEEEKSGRSDSILCVF
jgi:hypothetical protein